MNNDHKNNSNMSNKFEKVKSNINKTQKESLLNSYIFLFLIIILLLCLFFIIIKIYSKKENYYSFIDIKPSQINNNNEFDINEKFIIGIDFGSMNSGYSYTFEKDISKIISQNKFSTEIELSRDTQKGTKYSSKASISLMNYKEKELNNIIFFKGFKYFYASEINENINYIYPNDNNIDKKNALKEFFSLLKKDITNEIGHKYIKNKNIKWIFSIPSSWGQIQKQIIKNITIEAEIYNINFIYESEASSLSMYYDKYIPNNIKQKNKYFMIIDAGGLSLDITIYKILDNYGSMKEIIILKVNI